MWALRDFGIKVIIAPSFADIFYNNCVKNGILSVQLKHQEVEFLFRNSVHCYIKVDLDKQKVVSPDQVFEFSINSSHKRMLLEGLDEIALTLELERNITEYEFKKNRYRS